MNGGRGAKGSINDRLISMMYRRRYKLAEKKKRGYKKEEKPAQKVYLQSIQDFDLASDVTTLEEEDKEVVEEVFNTPPAEGNTVSTTEDIPVSISYEEPVIPFTPSFETKVKEVEQKAQEVEKESEPSVAELHDMSEKMEEIDITTEVFDFDHYDYYEVLQQYPAIAEYPESEVIDVEEEIEKVDDEGVILTELSDFIEESKELIGEIKEDLVEIEEAIPESKTQEEIEALDEKYDAVNQKVTNLKAQYDVVKEKYDFEEYEILDSIEMMSAIEDYHDKASFEELELLVDACKEEIDQIDDVLIEERRSISVAEDVVEKKEEIQERDEAFEKNKSGVMYLDNVEKDIAKEAREQAQIMKELEQQLNQFSTNVETVTRTVYHTERLFGSFLRIAAGIMTVPFSGRHVFGIMLGTHLINRGIRQLRASLNPEFVQTTEVTYRYQSVEREILNSKDAVRTTESLIDDSLYQLDGFEEEFKARFQAYSSVIPQYKEVENQIQSLKSRLQAKKEEVQIMQKDLDSQYERNKAKVKRASQ